MPLAPDAGTGTFPARQFVRDLNAVIAAKPLLTRRQWTSLLEAVLRLGTVSHVIWLCELHSRVWACLSEALGGAELGRASCRERVCQYGELSGVPCYIKKKQKKD